LLVEASVPPTTTPSGSDFEDGLFGRLLVASHLCPLQAMEDSILAIRDPTSASNSWAGEFFVEAVPIKPSIEADQRNIWQAYSDPRSIGRQRADFDALSNPEVFSEYDKCSFLITKDNDQRLCTLFKNLLRAGKQRNCVKNALLRWFGQCLHANKDLAEETRLTHSAAAMGRAIPKPLDAYPLISHLFFLAHTALRLSFAPLLSLHFETNRQLHQMEQEAQLLNPMASPWGGGMSDDTPQGMLTVLFCTLARLGLIVGGISHADYCFSDYAVTKVYVVLYQTKLPNADMV
ncbi:unnamed protein product, partial [Dibothriocephalus latus]